MLGVCHAGGSLRPRMGRALVWPQHIFLQGHRAPSSLDESGSHGCPSNPDITSLIFMREAELRLQGQGDWL